METSERRGGAHYGQFRSQRDHLELNRTGCSPNSLLNSAEPCENVNKLSKCPSSVTVLHVIFHRLRVGL